MDYIKKAFYSYAVEQFTDKNAIKGVKKYFARKLTEEEMVEILSFSGKEFNKLWKIYKNLN